MKAFGLILLWGWRLTGWVGCWQEAAPPAVPQDTVEDGRRTVPPVKPPPDPLAPIENPQTPAEKIVNGAKAEARSGVRYDPGYMTMDYPGGDVPTDQGACTDVVIRALRNAGYDLQQLIHEDLRQHFRLYPKKWGLTRPDPNIDHRRVPNQRCFFQRHGLTLTLEVSPKTLAEWQPGDLVYWKLDSGQDHCGVLSNVRNEEGWPWVIHNLSRAQQEDCLTDWEITGHFRYPGAGS